LNGNFFTSPSFSPDGRWLTWWVSQDEANPQRVFSLVMFDLVGKTNTTLHSYSAPSGTLGWLSNPIWSPTGQWLAFQTRSEVTPWDLWIIHRDGGIGQRFGLATNAVWSADSQHVAYVQLPPRADAYLPSSLSIIDVPSWFVQQIPVPVGSIPLGWK
jgi:Tol biopolymer transport system component